MSKLIIGFSIFKFKMMSRYSFLLLIFYCFFGSLNAQFQSLNGQWEVVLGNDNHKKEKIFLPGTLDDAKIGNKIQEGKGINFSTMAHLTRNVEFVGEAFYTRNFVVPKSWIGKSVLLKLGRVIWKSNVFIDGIKIEDSCESLTTSHEFNLTKYIRFGEKQIISLRINNSNIYPGINVYASQYPNKESKEITISYSNHTQIKWNGVLGEISLIAKPKVTARSVVITPDFSLKKLNIEYDLDNLYNDKVEISTFVVDPLTGKRWLDFSKQNISGSKLNAQLDFDNQVSYWDEFKPRLYNICTVIKSKYGVDTIKNQFGLRDLLTKNGDLYLNNKRLFIRGNLECVIFPKTGYPPMKVTEWFNLFKIAKSYGLNSFRFHSWCPPESAFIAADKIGFYLQVELPNWNLSVGQSDTASFAFLNRESLRILEAYGNHPSFMFFSMGNELEGDYSKLNALVFKLKQKDKRRLFTTTTFTFQKDISGAPQPADDFFVTQWTKKGWVRGQGVFNEKPPSFSKDYDSSLIDVNLPIITHEIGQYSVYPDLDEIKLYTGNLRPINFISVKEALIKKGLINLAPSFLKASGKFAALLYKEEIERALKTKGIDGFQLLQLQDFPGQGTALVGILNAFWKSKGFIEANDFKKFNSSVTPLLRFEKAAYTNNEVFEAEIELANFYKPLFGKNVSWVIKNSNGQLLQRGVLRNKNFSVNNTLQVGKIVFPLNTIKEAAKLLIEVKINGTLFKNDWSIWVYPAALKINENGVLVTNSKEEALSALNNGRNVLFNPVLDTLKGPKGKFVPVFWSPIHFPENPGTMGYLIKNEHKALADFPTEFHSNWQWWDLAINSKAVLINQLPDICNLVRPIDNFVTNNNLSSLFEVRLGKGKLLFSSFDIMTDLEKRPQAKQLKYSLLRYMQSKEFAPKYELELNDFLSVFKN